MFHEGVTRTERPAAMRSDTGLLAPWSAVEKENMVTYRSRFVRFFFSFFFPKIAVLFRLFTLTIQVASYHRADRASRMKSEKRKVVGEAGRERPDAFFY